ncbi:MAG: hypothetical protein SGILL_002266, partial [Bacillariaceae sp.]
SRRDDNYIVAKALLDTTKRKYPDAARVEMYLDGDRCESTSSLRRASVVVVHDSERSDRCSAPQVVSDDLFSEESSVESVEEVRTCQYVVHVCVPIHSAHDARYNNAASDHAWNFTAMSQVDAREFNETILATQELIGVYGRKTTAGANLKVSADVLTSLHTGLPPMPQTKVHANLKLINDMFIHAYDSYMYNGYPAPEVKPITCKQATFDLVKIPGLTLIDSLDTLVVLGNYTEFARATERLRHLNQHVAEETGLFNGGGLFAINQNVSVFETNIRVLGGLLSAHQLANAFLGGKVFESSVWDKNGQILIGDDCKKQHRMRNCASAIDDPGRGLERTNEDCDGSHFEEQPLQAGNETSTFWVYDGFLLRMAQDIGDRLLPAFATKTGIPFGTVNLLSGVPKGETSIASLAGGGTLSLEMELLGRLTGEERYGRAAKLAARALWMRRAPNNLLGKHICTRRGEWTESLSGIGSNSDSFYEYLMKHHVLFPEDKDFWLQLVATYEGVHTESRLGEWYADVDMSRGVSFGGGSRRVFEALMAFYPGLQVLLGEITPAARTLNSFFLVREHLGFLPERFNYGMWKVDTKGGTHLLRPELLESAYFLHRASKGIQQQFKLRNPVNVSSEDSSSWQWAGDFALHAIERLTRSECGYASPRDVSMSTTGSVGAEKHHVKLSNEMPSYFLSETLKYLYLLFDEENPLHTDEEREWIFTTEAHPFHYEKKSARVHDTSRLDQARASLYDRIQKRLNLSQDTKNISWERLQQEKWTTASDHGEFVLQLEAMEPHSNAIYAARRDTSDASSHVLNRFLPDNVSLQDFDKFDELQDETNGAALSFRSLGNGVDLTMACPNIYKAEYLWIRALNGGISDYSDIYMSTVQDEVAVPEHRTVFLGSVDALSLSGAGLHIDSLHDTFLKCPIRVADSHGDKSTINRKASGKHAQSQEQTTGSPTLFEMGEMGSFEVSAFSEGSGFLIQHVESGESLVTTLIDGEAYASGASETYVLVHNSASGEPSGSSSVVMADTNGKSYNCVVEVMQMRSEVNHEPVCEDDTAGEDLDREAESSRYGDVIAQFPCAPALFGPAHILNLQRVGTIEVMAGLRSPVLGEEYGCSRRGENRLEEPSTTASLSDTESSDFGESFCENSFVSIVHRGVCTFQEKAINQKLALNADGVIVINSEDELFVMSGNENSSSSSVPVSVLVSSSDGARLLQIADSFDGNTQSQIQARISLAQDEILVTHSEAGLAVEGNKFWPGVKASSEALQIFSASGWGVQATQRPKETGEAEWQLLLMTHGN